MGALDLERLVRLLLRAPVWGPVADAIKAFGGSRIAPVEVPAVAPGEADPALDAFVDACREGFCAGAGVIDITPDDPVGMPLAGFGSERLCTGLRDPLYARALVMSDGRQAVTIVALDLIGLSLPRVSRIRELLTARFGDGVLLACTHNHQSPDTLGLWGPALLGAVPYRTGLDPAYQARVERGVLAAVAAACDGARPAKLHLASGTFDRAGKWVHNERSSLRDTLLRVLHLTAEGGAPIATLAQYACHPETLWEHNRRMSADFCAACCRTMERSLGGVGLYVNGALGAMVTPALAHDTPSAERDAFAEKLGNALGRAAVRLARRGLDAPVEAPALVASRTEVRFPIDDNALYRLMHALGVVEGRDLKDGLTSEVCVCRVGPASFVGLPGEPAPALGLELLERVSGSPKFLVGLTNDELGYLLPPECFHDPAYGYEQTMTPGPLTALRLALALERLEASGTGGVGAED